MHAHLPTPVSPLFIYKHTCKYKIAVPQASLLAHLPKFLSPLFIYTHLLAHMLAHLQLRSQKARLQVPSHAKHGQPKLS